MASHPDLVERAGRHLDDRFRPEQLEQLIAHLPAQIPAAVADGQLVVACRRVLGFSDEAPAVEAAVRWDHPTLGPLPPGTFLAAVARSPHIGMLTAEVLRQACEQVTRWRAGGQADLEVVVTVTGRELVDGRIVERVRRALASSGLPARALRVAVGGAGPATPSTTAAVDHPRSRRTVERLRALGVRVAGAEATATWAPGQATAAA